jgi:hypothetical protein
VFTFIGDVVLMLAQGRAPSLAFHHRASERTLVASPVPLTIGKSAVNDFPNRRPLMCRLNLWHRWRPYSTEDGSNRYSACAKCGKLKPDRRGDNTIGA